MLPALPPARRRLRAARHRLRRHRRPLAATFAALAVLTALRVLAPAPPETVDVLVATGDLPSGTVLGRDDLERRAWPRDLAPPGAALAADEDPAGRVLAAPLARGEVLTTVRVVGPGLAAAHPGGTVLPVRLPDAGMASLLHTGDEVDLLATDPGTGEAEVVARGVTVLATPTGVPDGPAGGTGGALVVVEAAPQEAVQISSAGLTRYLTVTWTH